MATWRRDRGIRRAGNIAGLFCLLTLAGCPDGGGEAADAGPDVRLPDGGPVPDGGPDAWRNPQVWPPYLATSSWPGIHGGPYNSDFSFLEPGRGQVGSIRLAWRKLEGWAMLTAAIPDEDRQRVYVTIGQPDDGNLLAYGLTEDGESPDSELLWTASDDQGRPVVDSAALAGSPLLDEEGNVYVADASSLWSFAPDGAFRWRAELPTEETEQGPIHSTFVSPVFVPTGQVGGVTTAGRVLFFDRNTGEKLADLPLPGILPPSPPEDATGIAARLLERCVWVDAQDRPMMNDLLRLQYLAGFAGKGMAVSNTPTVVRYEDDGTGRPWGAVFVPALLETADASGLQDLKLFRIEVRQLADGSLEVVVPPDFDGLVPGGDGSATSPTLSPDGRLVFVGDDQDVLHAFDAESGQEVWQRRVGRMLGSVTVDSQTGDQVLVGTNDTLSVLDARTGEPVWSVSFTELARSRLQPLEDGTQATALVAGVAMTTPTRILLPLTLGYLFDFGMESGRGFVWPVESVLVVLDRQGRFQGDPTTLPDVVETGTVISRTGRILVTFGATMSSFAHCIWRNYGNTLARGMPEPIAPSGGFAVLDVDNE